MLILIGDRLCSHLHLFKRVSVVCAQVCVRCYPSFPRDAHTLQRVPPHTSRLLISQPKIPDCLGHTIQIGEIRKQQLRAPRIQGMPLESICFMLRWHGEGGQGDEHIFRFFFSFFFPFFWTIGIIHFKPLPHIVLWVDHTQRPRHA